MGIGKILKFLLSGIVVGAVLFLAGVGVVNLLNKPSNETHIIESNATVETSTPIAPEIVNSSNILNNDTVATSTESTATSEGSSRFPLKIKPLKTDSSEVEAEESEEVIEKIEFGTLTLSTVNTVTGEATNSDFLIENSDNIAIAQVKDTATSTLSLPVGDYKITVTNSGQNIVRFLGVKANQNGAEVFEVNAPALVQESTDPELVASENTEGAEGAEGSETPELAEPEKTINQETADAESDIATTRPATNAMGVLRLSALTEVGKRPVDVSFTISRLNGQIVENIPNVKTHQLSLAAGQYEVTAKSANASTIKQIEVLATKGSHEIFLISNTTNTAQQTSPKDTASTSTNTVETATRTAPTRSPSVVSNSERSNNTGNATAGKLELFALNSADNRPVKSNFYVQMPNGTMVASKVYVDSIGYSLPPGPYKVIVRANGFKDKSVSLNVRAGQTRKETFKLESVNAPVPNTSQRQNATPTYGGLTVNVISASNQSALPVNIVITQPDGTPLKQAFGVASASFDLPPREFVIKVTHNGVTTNHGVKIVRGQLAIKTISIAHNRIAQ